MRRGRFTSLILNEEALSYRSHVYPSFRSIPVEFPSGSCPGDTSRKDVSSDVSYEVRCSSTDMHHRSRCRHEIRFADVVAFFFFLHDAADETFQFFVAGAAAHLGVEIMVPHREQAGADFAVAGDADTAAVSAERMRDGRDDADFADAVVEGGAGAGRACGISTSGRYSAMRARISSSVTTVVGDQVRSSSSGMNSMKRTVTPSSRAK